MTRRWAATGSTTPPAGYIKRLRLDAGRTLLAQGVSATQAAHATGFQSTDGFRRAFHQTFGVAPGDYQRSFSSNGIAL